MAPQSAKAKEELLIRWGRDLSTCTEAELRERWASEDEQKAIDLLDPAGFEGRAKGHSPVYFLAERCWFDNVAGDPAYLYAPFHKERLSKPIESYVLKPKPGTAGMLLLAPRDSFKSTFSHGTVPMWFLLRQKHLFNKDARLHLEHHKEPLASANLMRLKAKFLFHPWVRRTWSDACPEYGAKDFGTKTEFTLPWTDVGYMSEPSVRASGSTASDAGLHVDLRCGDDLVTEEHIKSRKIREDARLRYEAKQFTRDTVRGRELNTGTRYHLHDLWSTMENASIDGRALYDVHRIKAIEDNDVLSLPYRLTKEFLEFRLNEIKERYGSDLMWYLQYQNDVRSSGITIAHPSWFKMVSRLDVSPRCWRFITIDGAWKGTKNAGEGDYAAIEVWAMERRGSLILRTLLDGCYSNELTAHEGANQVFRLMQKYGVLDVAPEEHGGYTFRGILENEATTRGQFISILELRSKQQHKQNRMSSFLKEMQAGHVFIAKECDQTLLKAFRSQVLDFPQCVEDECDALDAAAYTMDEEIQEAYSPVFYGPMQSFMSQPLQAEKRTRHCMA